MKVKEIQLGFYRHTFQRYEMVAPNIYLDWQFNEMDLMGLRRSGYIDEVEIKTSKSDFLADFRKTVDIRSEGVCLAPGHNYTGHFKKLKHEALPEGLPHCNYFSFLMPEEIAEKCDIPDYAGLYVCRLTRDNVVLVREKKKAPLLHKRKISDRMKYEVARKMAYRYWHQ